MSQPIRIQLSRRKGFRMADTAGNGLETVSVARPSPHGNPFRVICIGSGLWEVYHCIDGQLAGPTVGYGLTKQLAVVRAVTKHSDLFTGEHGALLRAKVRRELRGKNLACYCPLPAPGEPDCCHAATLLQIANAPEGS